MDTGVARPGCHGLRILLWVDYCGYFAAGLPAPHPGKRSALDRNSRIRRGVINDGQIREA